MTTSVLDHTIKDLALKLTVHAVRNTIIEAYHSEGKITDPEMKTFNKEVVNNLYTYLQILLNPVYLAEKKALIQNSTSFYLPVGWDAPELNQSIVKALR